MQTRTRTRDRDRDREGLGTSGGIALSGSFLFLLDEMNVPALKRTYIACVCKNCVYVCMWLITCHSALYVHAVEGRLVVFFLMSICIMSTPVSTCFLYLRYLLYSIYTHTHTHALFGKRGEGWSKGINPKTPSTSWMLG